MGRKLLTSKLWATIYLLIVVVIIITTFKMRTQWWCYFDIFFAFMATFSHLISTMFAKLIPAESRRLDIIALGMAIAMVVALVVETIITYSV